MSGPQKPGTELVHPAVDEVVAPVGSQLNLREVAAKAGLTSINEALIDASGAFVVQFDPSRIKFVTANRPWVTTQEMLRCIATADGTALMSWELLKLQVDLPEILEEHLCVVALGSTHTNPDGNPCFANLWSDKPHSDERGIGLLPTVQEWPRGTIFPYWEVESR